MTAATEIEADQMFGTLTASRIDPFLAAARGDLERALQLYGWNARASSALLLPAHFAEVVTRNAVSDVLARVYGADWPSSSVFEHSLSSTARGYSPRADLIATRRRSSSTAEVIAELKFVFWQQMFGARHAVRLWGPHFPEVFPNVLANEESTVRERVLHDLDAIRRLRNRIAHHEPIIGFDLGAELARMIGLIELRCASTAAWVHDMEDASTVHAERPGWISAGGRRTS
jgi:hypothetical protein